MKRSLSLCKGAGAVLSAVVLSAAAARAAVPVQTFLVPLPEGQLFDSLQAIYPGHDACNPPHRLFEVENPVTNVVSLAVISAGTVVYYDHWEDGYEADVTNPAAPTTETWGDGDPSNGAAPGYPADLFAAGDVVVLESAVDTAAPPALPVFGARDRVAVTKTVAVTRAAWAAGTGTTLSGAVEVYDTNNWGTEYVAPVGRDVSSGENFEYAALFVMAGTGGASVTADVDADGADDFSAVLGPGEGLRIEDVSAGARLTASAPVQADLVTGDVCAVYETRWYALVPRERWSGAYTTPVGTPPGDATEVFIYNPAALPATVHVESRLGPEPDLVAGPGGVVSAVVPDGSGARFSSDDGPFFALAAVDTGGGTHDWGFSLVPESELTPQVLVGWGPGRDPLDTLNPGENSSPVWFTPVAGDSALPVEICADFDGDGAGPLMDGDGGLYDELFVLGRLEGARAYDPDGDQTGMILYVCDGGGARLAAAWGQDPLTASIGAPALDVGTTVPPLPTFAAGKGAFPAAGAGPPAPGGLLRFEIAISNTGRVPVPDILLRDDVPAGTAYVEGSAALDDGLTVTSLPDAGATPFPFDEGGLVLGTLPSPGTFTVSFLVGIDPALPPGATIVNEAAVSAVGEERRPRAEVTLAVPPPGPGCVRSQGYWKNHAGSWPAARVNVGGVDYTPAEAAAVMRAKKRGDKTFNLFAQLAAARLNGLTGADVSCVAAAADAADAWLRAHPPGSGVRASSREWAAAAGWHALLDDYNNGLCAPHCGD